MKSLFEELGGTYTLGKDGMLYPNLMIEAADSRPIGKWAGSTGFTWKKRTRSCVCNSY